MTQRDEEEAATNSDLRGDGPETGGWAEGDRGRSSDRAARGLALVGLAVGAATTVALDLAAVGPASVMIGGGIMAASTIVLAVATKRP